MLSNNKISFRPRDPPFLRELLLSLYLFFFALYSGESMAERVINSVMKGYNLLFLSYLHAVCAVCRIQNAWFHSCRVFKKVAQLITLDIFLIYSSFSDQKYR